MSQSTASSAQSVGRTVIRRALCSVSDKTGLVPFAKALVARGVEILSTGGTAKHLAEAGIPVVQVSDYTGSPEIMDGRVKTLHPRVHGGILMRGEGDLADLAKVGGKPIDLVIVNLYPFEQTVAKGTASHAAIIEEIDIGGPSMVRSAAKSHPRVTVVVDPAAHRNLAAACSDARRADHRHDSQRHGKRQGIVPACRHERSHCKTLRPEDRGRDDSATLRSGRPAGD